MEIILQYKNDNYAVKVYEDGKLLQAGIRQEKKKAVKLFNELVKDYLECRDYPDIDSIF